MKDCERCGEETVSKVIVNALPMRFCMNDDCREMSGFWAWTLEFVPFTGNIFPYEGSYFKAMWSFLTRENFK